mgnify:CR=1 FL=1
MEVKIFNEAEQMAEAAATFVSRKITGAIRSNGRAHVLFATAGSQLLFLEKLLQKEIDWGKVCVFHLDEYKGLTADHPASFRKILSDHLLTKIQAMEVHLIGGESPDGRGEMERYAALLATHPIDVACIGIGENGHIAFNDPHVADFSDPEIIKTVTLDEACRKQQVWEGWFPALEDVPAEAYTLTIPVIMKSNAISCVVPGVRKAEAVFNALMGPLELTCPASILRTHRDAILFLDEGSASKLQGTPFYHLTQ